MGIIRRFLRGGLGLETICSLDNKAKGMELCAIRAFRKFRGLEDLVHVDPDVDIVLAAFHDWMLEQGMSAVTSNELKHNMQEVLRSRPKYRDAVRAFCKFGADRHAETAETHCCKSSDPLLESEAFHARVLECAWLAFNPLFLVARLMSRVATLFRRSAGSRLRSPKRASAAEGNTLSDASTSESFPDALPQKKRRRVTPSFIDDSGPVVEFSAELRQEVRSICRAKLTTKDDQICSMHDDFSGNKVRWRAEVLKSCDA